MVLTTGSDLGVYRILDTIGKGGMGEVYRAHDPRLDRDVAIKVLPAELAASHEMLDRFRREARAVAAVNHPAIVTIYSVEETDGVHFLTMELVEGRSLDHLIPASGLDAERIIAIAAALAGALAAAHDKGIVHRDIKPANVMITDRRGREGPRLRPREDARTHRRGRPWRGPDDRDAHRGGRGDGDEALHVARAGPGTPA